MKPTELKKPAATLSANLNLINGDFSPEDAKDILIHLISKKINFHKLRNFSSEIRFNVSDDYSQNKIIELGQTKEQVLIWLERAKTEGKSLRIHSTISIELIEK